MELFSSNIFSSYIFSKESFSYISRNETQHFAAQAQKIKKITPRKFLILQETEAPNKFFIFQETFYISGSNFQRSKSKITSYISGGNLQILKIKFFFYFFL